MEKRQRITKNDGFYLPLFNEIGLKASITPFFGGDLKRDYHHYALEPTTELSLFNHAFSRNVIFTLNQQNYYLNGQTELQQNDEVYLTVGRLYQIVERKNDLFSLKTTSFIPVKDAVELHQIIIQNHSKQPLEFDITTAIPLYGRSADNQRDHRHVTSLLNRVEHTSCGLYLKPTLSFDERGHLENEFYYGVFAGINDVKIDRIISNLDDFIDGGSLLMPKGIFKKDTKPGNGYETIAGIGFETMQLKPNESKQLYIAIGISQNKDIQENALKYFNEFAFNKALTDVKSHFNTYTDRLQFSMTNAATSQLLNWVVLQPVLRRFFGNSYLPHHDYGKGGSGWRDLWQDLLSLIMFNEPAVTHLLYSNFAGIRIDGSNATIIGDKPGEFKADRNNIVRVWSDHGAWPLLTTLMYIHETGDLNFLFRKQVYFDDQFTHYTKQTKESFAQDFILKNDHKVYEGTILEHLLIQNIVAHFNVGKAGFVRLEDADWNDGLDMASNKGETIAFTHFYAQNLKRLKDIISHTKEDIYLLADLVDLIFERITIKTYFDRITKHEFKQIKVDKQTLLAQLEKLYLERLQLLRTDGWVKDSHLQSYINNQGLYVDDIDSMSLTGQAMALLSHTVTFDEAKKIATKTKQMLFKPELGGYLLNTDYKKVMMDMGRAYGFQYGHKENGAMFSHMALMYVYGLYNYDLVTFGAEGYQALLQKALDPASKMLSGIPEYFNDRGIGKYSFLTGSASWLLKLLRDHVFGIKMDIGKLSFEPKLVKREFIDGKASIQTVIHGKIRKIIYLNPKGLDYGAYRIVSIQSNGIDVTSDLTKIGDKVEVYLDEI